MSRRPHDRQRRPHNAEAALPPPPPPPPEYSLDPYMPGPAPISAEELQRERRQTTDDGQDLQRARDRIALERAQLALQREREALRSRTWRNGPISQNRSSPSTAPSRPSSELDASAAWRNRVGGNISRSGIITPQTETPRDVLLPTAPTANEDEENELCSIADELEEDGQCDLASSLRDKCLEDGTTIDADHTCWLCWHVSQEQELNDDGLGGEADIDRRLGVVNTINRMFVERFAEMNEPELCRLIAEYHRINVYEPALENDLYCERLNPDQVMRHFRRCIHIPEVESIRQLRRIAAMQDLTYLAVEHSQPEGDEKRPDERMINAYEKLEKLRHMNMYQKFKDSSFNISGVPIRRTDLNSIVTLERCLPHLKKPKHSRKRRKDLRSPGNGTPLRFQQQLRSKMHQQRQRPMDRIMTDVLV